MYYKMCLKMVVSMYVSSRRRRRRRPELEHKMEESESGHAHACLSRIS